MCAHKRTLQMREASVMRRYIMFEHERINCTCYGKKKNNKHNNTYVEEMCILKLRLNELLTLHRLKFVVNKCLLYSYYFISMLYNHRHTEKAKIVEYSIFLNEI